MVLLHRVVPLLRLRRESPNTRPAPEQSLKRRNAVVRSRLPEPQDGVLQVQLGRQRLHGHLALHDRPLDWQVVYTSIPRPLSNLTRFGCAAYPIIWALGEGANVLSPDIEVLAYAIMDVSASTSHPLLSVELS